MRANKRCIETWFTVVSAAVTIAILSIYVITILQVTRMRLLKSKKVDNTYGDYSTNIACSKGKRECSENKVEYKADLY